MSYAILPKPVFALSPDLWWQPPVLNHIPSDHDWHLNQWSSSLNAAHWEVCKNPDDQATLQINYISIPETLVTFKSPTGFHGVVKVKNSSWKSSCSFWFMSLPLHLPFPFPQANSLLWRPGDHIHIKHQLSNTHLVKPICFWYN